MKSKQLLKEAKLNKRGPSGGTWACEHEGDYYKI
jgi:hypothetical protein